MTQSHEKNVNDIHISIEKKALIVDQLITIINEFKKEYPEEFLIRELMSSNYHKSLERQIRTLRKNSQIISYDAMNHDPQLKDIMKKKQDQSKLVDDIRSVAREHKKFNESDMVNLFKIVLDILDFILGGTIGDLQFRHNIGQSYLSSLVKLISVKSPMEKFYERRFYHNRFIVHDVLTAADNIKDDLKTNVEIKKLLNPQLQTLFSHYRKQHHIKKGTSLFSRPIIEPHFTRWVSNLDPEDLDLILTDFKNRLSKDTLMILCSQINKNLIILKYIVYALKFKASPSHEISEISGKSVSFIEKYEKLIYYNRVI